MLLTELQQQIADAAKAFSLKTLLPEYQARERHGVLDRNLVKQLGDLGFLGVDLPEAVGGMGLDALSAGVLAEQMAYGDFNISALPVNVSLVGSILMRYAHPDVAGQWLPKMIAGEVIVAICLTEPSGGS
ncbi:MAG: acyl-CoA dehydrogenase family protein, partial [Gammaproteobacteria bacterium]|nr:acyl-CoA dehydrogenase family protein [Gammaproteobacteria bacterium]MBU1833530.1 acyl-CoA dehydrogenase family protein [Gammaproteobacteria bacterium]